MFAVILRTKRDALGLRARSRDPQISMQKEKIVMAYCGLWDILKGRFSSSGQTMIESTFGVLVIVMLILSLVRVFFWVGADLAARSAAHERTLVTPVTSDDVNENYRQIRPMFYEGLPMNATTIRSDIFGVNRLR